MKQVVTVKHAQMFFVEKHQLKEEIKAVYGYEKVYSVSTVSHVKPVAYSNDRNQEENSNQKGDNKKFADVLEKSMSMQDGEVKYSSTGYDKNGAYLEYLYLTREYRR